MPLSAAQIQALSNKPPTADSPKPGGLVIGTQQPQQATGIQSFAPRPSSYSARPTSLAPGYIMGPDGKPKWVGEREAARIMGGSPGFGGAYVPGASPTLGSGPGDLSGLLGSLGLGGGGAGGGGVAGAGAEGGAGTLPDWVTQTEYDPFLQRHAQRIEERLGAPDTVTQRAIERAAGAIRDLGEGQQAGIRERFQRMGAEGGEAGAEEEALGQLREDIQGRAAGAAADISMQRERERMQELLGATGALGAPGEAAARDRQLALQQWSQLEAARRAREALDIEREGQRIGVIRSIFDLLPVAGGGVGSYGFP